MDDLDVVVGESDGGEGEGGKTAIQTKGLLRSAHSRVGTTMEMTISTPPMVGVPAFFWCALGPSSRMYWPIWNSRSFDDQGPMINPVNSAVRLAKAVRNVR